MSPRRLLRGAAEFQARFVQGGLGEDVAGHRLQQSSRFDRPWFNSETGRDYLDLASRESFRKWCYRYGVVAVKGRYAKADIDRVLARARRSA
jgi:hypothetical protein